MISYLLLGFGLVMVIEGLVIALAPSVYDEVLKVLNEMRPSTRSSVGLIIVAVGVVMVWLSGEHTHH